MLFLWTMKGTTWRMPIALTIIYFLKFVCASLFKIRYPHDYLWEYPGFYSLTVPYGMSNDFHFSVHIALLLVIL